MKVPLARRALAEALGTGALVAVVVGSGIMAQRLSPADTGLELLENSTATALGLAVLILVFAPVSGAHFNPVVTLADHVLKRFPARRADLDGGGADGKPESGAATIAVYVSAQLVGGVGGAVLANVMFGLPPVVLSTHARSGAQLWLGETVATCGLVLLVFSLTRTERGALAPLAVGSYIGAAYWFTSSTSFANPAVTLGRAFTDSFAGIRPASLAGFAAAQLLGAALGVLLVLALFPAEPAPGGGRGGGTVRSRRATTTTTTLAPASAPASGITPDAGLTLSTETERTAS